MTQNPIVKFIEEGIERFGSFDAFADALAVYVDQTKAAQR
jgi:hypothetical protein